jgi:signal recognition particle GTPase
VIEQGQFTLRDMYEQFQNVMKLGPLNKVSPHVYPSLHHLLIKLLTVQTSDPQPAYLKTRRPVA